MNEEIKVIPVEAEEFYSDRGEVSDQELLNFKPLNEELSLSGQKQTIETLNQQIRNLRIELENYALDHVIWIPDSWYANNGPTEELCEYTSVSAAVGKLRTQLMKLEQRLTKAGL